MISILTKSKPSWDKISDMPSDSSESTSDRPRTLSILSRRNLFKEELQTVVLNKMFLGLLNFQVLPSTSDSGSRNANFSTPFCKTLTIVLAEAFQCFSVLCEVEHVIYRYPEKKKKSMSNQRFLYNKKGFTV